MPPEIMAATGVDIPMMRRDPHYFLPTTGKRYLLFGSDAGAMKRAVHRLLQRGGLDARTSAMNDEIAQIRDDIAPTWMEEPLSIEETAEKYVRARSCATAFVDLCRRPVGDYLDRFGFKSDLVQAMYAVTDGFSGLYGTWDTPGTGMNFLVHNMCRLPGFGRHVDDRQGRHGHGHARCSPTRRARLGATIETGKRGRDAPHRRRARQGRACSRRAKSSAPTSSCVNADPFRMRDLVGRTNLPADVQRAHRRLREADGSTFKVNLALRGLPKFTCLPEDTGQYGPTIHLLPDEKDVMRHDQGRLRDGAARASSIRFPTIEWYIHTTVDPSLKDDAGPSQLARSSCSGCRTSSKGTTLGGGRGALRAAAAVDLRSLRAGHERPGRRHVRAAPAEDRAALRHHARAHPPRRQRASASPTACRTRTPIAGLYSCSAGCHPAGGVIGAAGHNAANRVLKNLSV